MKERVRGIGLRAWGGGLNGGCGSRQGLFGSLGPGKDRDLQSSEHKESKNAMHEFDDEPKAVAGKVGTGANERFVWPGEMEQRDMTRTGRQPAILAPWS